MNRLLVVAVISLVTFEAAAATRYDITKMSCADVQALVEKEGAAILRYGSARVLGLPLYDRYVQSQKYCAAGEIARGAGVPTADQKYCPVHKCVESDIFVSR